MTDKTKKGLSILSIGIFIVMTVAIFFVVGKPLLQFIEEPEQFRVWIDSFGFLGKLIFVGLVTLQVIIAIIPGEPFEIYAGYGFGAIEGTILCIVGALLGSTIVYLFVKYCGIKALEVFFSKEQIESVKFLQDTKRLELVVFLLFFIPGTPKDIMTYFIGLTKMKLSTWLLITGIARLPSIITSTVGGDALGLQNYQFAIVVFGVAILVSLIGILVYQKFSKSK